MKDSYLLVGSFKQIKSIQHNQGGVIILNELLLCASSFLADQKHAVQTVQSNYRTNDAL